MQFTKEHFIDLCQASSTSAYDAFKELIRQLSNDNTRSAALDLVQQLKTNASDYTLEQHSFRLFPQVILDHHDKQHTLWLFQFPSTFEPEDWSFTFYEGLVRYPDNEFYQRTMTELGCGIGWITIALALRYRPQMIVGVDINPKAITCAQLNLLVNAFNEQGEALLIDDNRGLLDCVSFYQSDLLSHFDGKKNHFDYIIGCIPQVLNPEPEVMETLVAETANDDYLLSLSNYCAVQGYIEDQFGLGLIAKAVEQSICLVKPQGKLILNLGGRPGQAVLERLIKRRGFNLRRIWQNHVKQAADTDIDALVAIEETTGHKFEFYINPDDSTPITATTAADYARADGKIFHTVDVYEAQLNYPEAVKTLYQSLLNYGNDKLKSAVDLTIENPELAEERYSFIAHLSLWLQSIDAFPYESTKGITYFRQQIKEFLRYYHHVEAHEDNILITPGRKEFITNLLNSCELPLVFMDSESKSRITNSHLPADTRLLEVPTSIELQLQLIEQLKPAALITQIQEHEVHSVHLIEQLIKVTEQHQCLLVLDLSNHVELSSQTQSHAIYRWLANNSLPQHLLLSIALINNKVYQDLSLNIVVSANPDIQQCLTDSAELSYSRTPVINQLYYGHLFEELLFFQRTRLIQDSGDNSATKNATTLNATSHAKTAFQHPAITGNHLPFGSNTLRMDYGENELPAPRCLKQSVLESFLLNQLPADETSPEMSIRRQLEQRFAIPQSWYADMAFNLGVAPMYSTLLSICHERQQTLLFPTGSYGYFVAAADYYQLKHYPIETQEQDHFKLTPELLRSTLTQHPNAWLFLNAPVVNPTGALYTNEELNEIMTLVADMGGTLILDTIFSGLEFDAAAQWNIKQGVEALINADDARLILVSGIAKEYAAGGLRFGYAWSHDRELMQQLDRKTHRRPHFTMGYAIRETIEAQLTEDPELMKCLAHQRQTLSSRAERLTKVLSEQGWDVLVPKAGLFLVAKPKISLDALEQDRWTEATDRIARRLFDETGVVINNATWTGLPGYCRFVLSIPEADFEQALERLANFELSS
ncbi:aminotransferase class I/II-fold pyridoxal phosphate-dependent enzyme [Pleionea sp. CnH1-48]|uniref:aminotransferase class I/II-fold pyridoxal phosphate-dependent enzyme n=1 Tax=Pleionea sp. CnH1-48 TaxID=2954494 RepID=UPI002096E681|nr:aminotransferase class I/II-fold pyridoxal phosphate-dependent enzyme [Pleionea sp. CnH1-48]MCO7225840.1 aminotransferase class I/II-fold pyridoxal phosphate-dependent enzyme [Pleionea sp. CnH1-48]